MLEGRPWRIVALGLVLLWVAVIGTVWRVVPREDLENALSTWAPAMVAVGFVILLVALVLCRLELAKIARRAGSRPIIALGLVLAGAGILRLFVVPAAHRVFNDEHVYEEMGLSIAFRGDARAAHAGIYEEGRLTLMGGRYEKWPSAFPVCLALAYRLFGAGEGVAFTTNVLLSVAGIAAVGLVGALFFREGRSWLYAAIVYAILPQNNYWAHSASVEPSAAAFGALAIAAVALAAEFPSWRTYVLAASALAASLQFRMESLFLLPVALAVVTLRRPGEFRSARFWGATLLLALLLSGHVLHTLSVSVEYDPAMGEGIGFEAAQFLPNLRTNARFFVDIERFPVPCTILALVGLLASGEPRSRLVIALWFLLFWGVFLFYYLGSYYFHTEERYSLVCLAPFALLAGRGWEKIISGFGGRGTGFGRNHVHVFADPNPEPRRPTPGRGFGKSCRSFCLFALLVALYLPQMRTVDPKTAPFQAEHEFVARTFRDSPEDALFLSTHPSIPIAHGRSGVASWLVLDKEEWSLYLVSRRSSRVFLYHGLTHGPDSPEETMCRAILERYDHRVAGEMRVGRFDLVFYELWRNRKGDESP
ncbi:MAG: glycosyltransferase family 39 protein [Planctomycetes bacterium]|nr:glycosyltransferase family 39 protein [Planctomycetota bacterium]